MANETLRTVGMRVVAEGAETATQNVKQFDDAQKGLANTLDSVATAQQQVTEQIRQSLDEISKQIELNKQRTIQGEGFTMRDPELAQAYEEAIRLQDEYFESLNRSTQASYEFSRATEAVGKSIDDENVKIGSLGSEWKAAFNSFKQLGDSPKTALDEIFKAVRDGIPPSQVLRHNLDELTKQIFTLAKEGKSWKEISEAMAKQAGETANAHGRLSESAIHSSRAFFALTLASFGVMSVAQELKKSFGDDLPPAFEKTSSAIQQIASFGSAGAFIGGAPGAIFGGIAGGLIAITTAAVTLDPELQRLNQQLDNMSNRDEFIDTMARIAGVSTDVAKVWDDAARKDPDFASKLERIIKAAEPVPGLLATISAVSKELTGSFDGLAESIGGAGDALNKILLASVAGYVGYGTLAKSIAEGKDIQQAFADAQAAALRVMQGVEEATKGHTLTQKEANDVTAEAEKVLEKETNSADKLADAQRRLADATEDASHRMSLLAEKTANQYAQAQQQYSNAVQDAAEQRANAVFNAEQTLTNRISDLWQDLQNKVADINQNLADKISDIQVQLHNRIADIQSQLSDRIADIQQQLADKIRDINQDLQNKLQDLAHSRDQAVQGANQKILDASRELSRKLYEIERDRLEAIEALAFSTHEQLQDARTDHDRDRILRRAQFEQGQIDQKANDARKDAIADYQDKVAQAEREKKLAKDTYDYQVMLAKQLAAQKIANAQHDADVQIAQAQRQAQQQLAIAQRQAQQQLDIAQREAAQQLALAQRRHEQELATAQRSYQQQVEAARRAEQQRVADAQRALEQRNAAIAQSHDAERKQIEYTLQKAIEAYQRQIAEIKNLALAVQALIQQYMILAGIAENIAKLGSAATTGLFGDWINNIHDVVKEGTVPTPPLTPLLGGTREGNIITPASINTSTRNNSINIVINDATDARKVGEVVRRELAQVAWR